MMIDLRVLPQKITELENKKLLSIQLFHYR